MSFLNERDRLTFKHLYDIKRVELPHFKFTVFENEFVWNTSHENVGD